MRTSSSPENNGENKRSCCCCFCVSSHGDERQVTRPGSCSISNCLKVQKSTMFFLQAFVVWIVLCLPGNIVTLILYQKANNNIHQVSISVQCIIVEYATKICNKISFRLIYIILLMLMTFNLI